MNTTTNISLPTLSTQQHKRSIECAYFRPSLPRPRCGLIDTVEGRRVHIEMSDCDTCMRLGPSSPEADNYRKSIREADLKKVEHAEGAIPCSKCLGVQEFLKKEGMGTFARVSEHAKSLNMVLTPHGLFKEGVQLPTRTTLELLNFLGLKEEDLSGFRVAAPDPLAGVLESFFDRVVVINLKRKVGRLFAFQQRLAAQPWPFAQPQVVEAIDGLKVPHPRSFRSGSGGWGCLRSHLGILEQALNQGVKQLLVLEDDAAPVEGFAEKCRGFFSVLPSDWDMLVLGGQHMNLSTEHPKAIRPGVIQVFNTQRTHAYAVRGRGMEELYHLWMYGNVHCDWSWNLVQKKVKAYAPEEWLMGQGANESDISGRAEPDRYWHTKMEFGEVHVVTSPQDPGPEGAHHGNEELLERARRTGTEDSMHVLREWSREIREQGKVPTIRCHRVWTERESEVRQAFEGRLVVRESPK